jgi:uridine kinase
LEPRRLSLGEVASRIAWERTAISPDRALVVGISGIDGSGKGFVTTQIADELRKQVPIVTPIGADGWLNLPPVRFNDVNPGLHFYENAFRLDQMFADVISPLRQSRSVKCEVDHVEETAKFFSQRSYKLEAVDVVLVEGIFLYKPQYRDQFDLRVWIDCSFETALDRAVRRSQEGLSAADTIAAYQKIYFPAQRIHLDRDQPIQAADIIINNDDRLNQCFP